MIALLDGDIVAYRVGWTANGLPLDIAQYRVDTTIQGILQSTGSDDYQIYLTDSVGNYRNSISKDYKATRKDEKPEWLEELKEYLIVTWGAKISLGQEADDALGIHQTKESFNGTWFEGHHNTVICSIDKDLLQIPGYHYNFVKDEHIEISPKEGLYNFYKQLLVGDVTDNVKGAPGIGEVKARKALDRIVDPTEVELFQATQEAYRSVYKKEKLTDEEIDAIILLNAQLLYIRKREEEIWNFPTKHISIQPLLQYQDDQLSSTISTEVENSPSTEPTSLMM